MKNICEYSSKELFLNLGLYQDISINYSDFITREFESVDHYNSFYSITEYKIEYSEQFKRLIDFMSDTENIYAYCPLCNKQISFKQFPITLSDELKNSVLESYNDHQIDEDFRTNEVFRMKKRINKITSENRIFDKFIKCTHDNSHLFRFSYLIKIQGEYPQEFLTLTKIGQYPSINDFSTENIKSYQKLLKDYKNEYTKALGLYSAGIGIGSFVYLRRILEFLLENTFKRAEEKGSITREQYMKDDDGRNRSFGDKIKQLQDHLPDFMVSNTIIYNVLSKGIHELDEETCKEIFPILQSCIELILDEEIAIQKKQLLTRSAQQQLNEINTKLKNNI